MKAKTILMCAMALGGACMCGAGEKELTLGEADGLPCELTLVEIPGSGSVAGFAMSKGEITQKQYDAVMGKSSSAGVEAQRPAKNLTFPEAMGFCDRLNELVKRPNLKWALPTSDQWNRAVADGKALETCGAGGFHVVVVDEGTGAGTNVAEQKSHEETATERTRRAVAWLFPGWSLNTDVHQHEVSGFHANHRGQDNVVCVHPKSVQTPAILSRTVALSDKNPCLFLKVASWTEETDYLLSVRVNGMEALPNRLISTPDYAPWEEIVVPLSDWRGTRAKIEVVFTANGWQARWPESPMLARVEIAECRGDMRIVEGMATVDGYTWSYRAQNGEATIIAEKDGQFSRAVSPCPIGEISIPATLGGTKVTRIGRGAFKDCSGLTSVTIPEGVSCLGRDSLRDCTGLRSVKIPPSVKTIECNAFAGCNALTSVTLPPGLVHISRGAFWWCCALPSVTIPSGVTHIGQDAFVQCKCLTSVTLPQTVTDIGWQAFRGCNALTSMTIPASVTNINHTAFCDTGAMTSFRVEAGNPSYKSESGLLLTKDGTALVRGVNGDVKIPEGVIAIGPCAFEGSVALRQVVLPSGVKSIGDCAFKQCRGLSSVTIPESVTSIGCWAFNNCSGLKSMTLPATLTNIDRTAFDGCTNLKSVDIVKDGKVESVPFAEFIKRWQGKRAAEREEQRRQLQKIQEALQRAREARKAAAKGKSP